MSPRSGPNAILKRRRVTLRCAFRLAVAAPFARWLGATIADAGPFDLPPSDFDIIDATESTQVIGHGHYEITPDGPATRLYSVRIASTTLSTTSIMGRMYLRELCEFWGLPQSC
jgi:hypothetical protein